MRAARNISLGVLVCVTLVFANAAKVRAGLYMSCGYIGLSTAAFLGDDDADCAAAELQCANYETNSNACRSLCLGQCDTATQYSLSYCNITELGGMDRCSFELGCVCDTDVSRR